MELVTWLGDFLESRGCEDRKPDGRPLYAYRCTTDEFSVLTTLLRAAEKNLLGNEYHLGYGHGTERLFTLYCAEWWRRSYKGGAWKWEPIKNSLGWHFCEWQTSADFVRKGLRFWDRNLISTGSSIQYLLSVASEGGIPVNVLKNEGAAFRSYLKSIIREYGIYGQAGFNAEKIADENQFRLPNSWQRPQIVSLAGQIVEKIWYFKSKIGEVSNPVQVLNQTHPGWSDQLPLVLDDDQAELLVNALIRTAKEAESGVSQHLKVERVLEKTLISWRLRAKILIPKKILIANLVELVGQSEEIMPERLEMYRSVAGHRQLVGKLTKIGGHYSVRAILNAHQALDECATDEQEIVLVNRGNLFGNLPVLGGAALDSDIPWVFAQTDELAQSFRFLAQGGCKRREPSLFVLSQVKPVPLTGVDITVQRQNENEVLGRFLWKVDGPAIVSDKEGENYRIEPGLQNVAIRDYRLIGERRYFPITKNPLFTSMPQIQWIEEASIGFIPRSELVWRTIGTMQWCRSENTNEIFGDVEIRHRKDNEALAAWRISILPKSITFEIEPVSRTEGKIHINGLEQHAVHIANDALLEIRLQSSGENKSITCQRVRASLTEIHGRIKTESNNELAFQLPFPAEGAAFIDSSSVEIDKDFQLAQSRLYGVRAQSMSLGNRRRYLLRATIVSNNQQLSAVQHHWFECPMLMDDSGLSTLPLQQINQEISLLFAIGTGVDDKIKVELIEPSRTVPTTSVMIKQFEGTLHVDQWSRVVTLFTDISLYSEYENQALLLISVNDFSSDPITLPWNGARKGWSLPDYAEMESSHTYFATVAGDQAQLIRPRIIPGEGTAAEVGLSDLRRALIVNDTDDRLQAIGQALSQIMETDERHVWVELCSALKRFSTVHPDGLDLVECLIEEPKLLANIWFYSIGDQELRDYLRRITETSPFSWWMISAQDWLESAQRWYRDEVESIGNEEVSKMLLQQGLSELSLLVDEEAELNAVGDVIQEQFGEQLPAESVIDTARKFPLTMVWKQLDNLGRSVFVNEIGESRWPLINQVFELQRKLPEDLFRLIDWPVSDLGHQKSVMQAPVIAAAALHAGVEINQNHRIALMAARNFHPSAFATNFRATQAALWVYEES